MCAYLEGVLYVEYSVNCLMCKVFAQIRRVETRASKP